MAKDFASQINRLAAMMPVPLLKPEQHANVEAGRMVAAEFIEAARAGKLPSDGLGLVAAICLLNASTTNSELLLRGFLQTLQKALEGDC